MLKLTLLNGLIVSLLGSTALAQQAILPESASNHAGEVDFALNFVNAVTVIFFILIIALMVFFAWRFRRKDVHQKAESQLAHHTVLELAWTIPPFIIVVYIFYIGLASYLNLTQVPDNAYEISVRAQKWSWNFVHPNGASSPALHVPADTPVKLLLTSDDVLHSLFVPAFRVKKDVVPGRYNTLWFVATKQTEGADAPLPEGPEFDARLADLVKQDVAAKNPNAADAELAQKVQQALAEMNDDSRRNRVREELDRLAVENGYQLYCTEFCGTSHSTMLAKVVVHKPSWRPAAGPPEPVIPTAEYGKYLFQIRQCVGCHQINPGGPQLAGPTFAGGIFGRQEQLANGQTITVDKQYLHDSIVTPLKDVVAGFPPAMPTFGHLPPKEIQSLVLYIESLGGGQ